eukprot:710625_1
MMVLPIRLPIIIFVAMNDDEHRAQVALGLPLVWLAMISWVISSPIISIKFECNSCCVECLLELPSILICLMLWGVVHPFGRNFAYLSSKTPHNMDWQQANQDDNSNKHS